MDFKMILRLICVAAILGAIDGRELEMGCVDALTSKGEIEDERLFMEAGKPDNLYSPGFLEGELYPDNILCEYQITAPPGMHVRIHFNLLDIHAMNHCKEHFLELYDSDIHGRTLKIERLCGNLTIPDYISKSDALLLKFRTDGFNGGRGFSITYSAQTSDKLCSSGQMQCQNRKCVDSLVICDGKDDCGDGTDEESCADRVLPVPDECGRPEIDPISFGDFDRIVGGRDAVHGSWPWMAELTDALVTPNAHICGGTLINAQWVLTAAHCFKNPAMHAPKRWRIHVGKYRKFERDDSQQTRYNEQIVVYNDGTLSARKNYSIQHDMALIKLNAPVKFSKYVNPVCLPDGRTKLNITSKCYATGWGMSRGTGNSDRLKQAFYPVQPDAVCRRLRKTFQSSTMICAGSMAPLNGACKGDSGGPLVCQESDGRWSIQGVASSVTDGNSAGLYKGTVLCGVPGRPSVFNKVAVKTSWIRKIINRYS